MEKNKKLKIAYDVSLFKPQKNQYFDITPIWGPYSSWEENYEVLVFAEYRKARLSKKLDFSLNQYQQILEEKFKYEKYVIAANDMYFEEKCYRRRKILENGSEILVLE